MTEGECCFRDPLGVKGLSFFSCEVKKKKLIRERKNLRRTKSDEMSFLRFEPIETVIKRIMTRYNENPRDWRVLIDKRGNALVLGPESGYKLRFIHINPQEYTGVGVKIRGLEEIQENLRDVPSYGFRPLTKERTKTFLEGMQKQDAQKEAFVRDLFKIHPVPTQKVPLETEAILSGPIITHPDLGSISREQRKLDARLNLEAERLFRLKYPARARMYD